MPLDEIESDDELRARRRRELEQRSMWVGVWACVLGALTWSTMADLLPRSLDSVARLAITVGVAAAVVFSFHRTVR